MSRGASQDPALGLLVGGRDHTSPGPRIANDLSRQAEEFLRMGQPDNAGPGMVCNLAIRIPVAFQHAESRLVSVAVDTPPRPGKARPGRTIDWARLFPHAM
jgi:hypothetical protein